MKTPIRYEPVIRYLEHCQIYDMLMSIIYNTYRVKDFFFVAGLGIDNPYLG